MIFATVGMQMPFDRLVRTVDAWAGAGPRRDVFAQIGRTDYRPAHVEWTAFLDPAAFRQRLFDADVVVTHAGVGTILTALELGRPLVLLPRRGDRRETRNDHQLGTARAFAETVGIEVAHDETELPGALDRAHAMPPPRRVTSHASIDLLTALRDLIRHDAPLPRDGPLPLRHPAAGAHPVDDRARRAA